MKRSYPKLPAEDGKMTEEDTLSFIQHFIFWLTKVINKIKT